MRTAAISSATERSSAVANSAHPMFAYSATSMRARTSARERMGVSKILRSTSLSSSQSASTASSAWGCAYVEFPAEFDHSATVRN